MPDPVVKQITDKLYGDEPTVRELENIEHRLALLRAEAETQAADLLASEVRRIASWIERDRREPDKILCHVVSLRRAALDARP